MKKKSLFDISREEAQARAEADAKKHTFNPGTLAAGALTLATGGGAAPLLLSALGEGVRANTGSDMDLAGMASLAGSKFLPELTPDMVRNKAITTPGIGLQNAATPTLAKALPTVASEPSMMDRFLGYINPMNESTWTQPVSGAERANIEQYNKLRDTGQYMETPKVAVVGNMSLDKIPLRGQERPGYTQYQDPNTLKYSYVKDASTKNFGFSTPQGISAYNAALKIFENNPTKLKSYLNEVVKTLPNNEAANLRQKFKSYFTPSKTTPKPKPSIVITE